MEGLKYQRPTWVEIDLSALEYNLEKIKTLLNPGTAILATVKSDGYGHGLLEVSRKFSSLGTDFLGVASLEEALRLRKAGLETPILIMGAILPQQLEPVVDEEFRLCISERHLARALNSQASKKGKRARVHIKVDTGMGRLGIWHEEALEFILEISKFGSLDIEGIFTHFPSAEDDINFTRYQIDCFNGLIRKLKRRGLDIPYKHAANSAGLIGYRQAHFNLVRPGLLLYGLSPVPGLSKLRLKPAMSLKTKIVHLKSVPAGRSISYGRSFVTKKDSTIAVLPVGYSDGYSRLFSNKAQALLKGRRLPVVGRVCMDQTMLDASEVGDVNIGDEVVLLGQDGSQRITAQELAEIAGTISYEIVCSIGRGARRIYK
jgi:alanine racemase